MLAISKFSIHGLTARVHLYLDEMSSRVGVKCVANGVNKRGEVSRIFPVALKECCVQALLLFLQKTSNLVEGELQKQI